MLVRILYYYFKTLYLQQHLHSREQLKQFQNKQLKKKIHSTLARSPFYQKYINKPFNEWPIMNKSIMMEKFDEINTAGIKKEAALFVAKKAESTRDFSPLLNDIAVGLSSGTSGKQGIFLASPKERDMWAGIMLAKVLPDGLTNERVAFFLRANNQLYKTLNKSQKIQFHFFDLLTNFDDHLARLNSLRPTIISAPSSVLMFLATHKQRLTITPKKIIAVAEVLEEKEEKYISNAFNLPVSQIYQCTEGFLAVSDKRSNTLTMNEEYLIIEKEWLDENRFIPIITDLVRSTQPIIRYRLDDVLIAKQSAGVFTELLGIEGRLGDVIYGKSGASVIPIFADLIRQKIATIPLKFEDYRICQHQLNEFSLQVFPDCVDKNDFITYLNQIFVQMNCEVPNWHWQGYQATANDVKKRRITSSLGLDHFSIVKRT